MPTIGVSIPSEMHNVLDRIAYEERKGKSEIVQEALRLYFGKRKSEKPTEKSTQKRGA